MKQQWMYFLLASAMIAISACTENTSTETENDTINAPLVDTIGVPTQGYNPDPGSLHVPDTMPLVDSVK